VQSVRALLGDRDDRAVTSRTGPNVIGGIDANGGSGDDVLTGSPTIDHLDGGGGTDVLRGGGENDTLTDGDRDGAGPGAAPDADTLDGGPGPDTLSYAQRARGVVVNLNKRHAGEPGERDTIRNLENVVGGRGDDRLTALRQRQALLDGRGGSNHLVGGDRADILRHASGRRVACGRGADWVTLPRAGTLIPRTCERLAVRAPRNAILDNSAIVGPTPRRRAGVLGFAVTCPSLDGEPQDCRARARIRSRGRLVASGRIRGGAAESRFLGLHLTALGRRLDGDGRTQRATTILSGPLMRRTAWTIAF
jgi:hypothetical protein